MSTLRGFTLLETLIYIALLGLLMFGVVTAAVGVEEMDRRNYADSVLLQEALYLERRLAFEFSKTSELELPTSESVLVSKFLKEPIQVNAGVRSITYTLELQTYVGGMQRIHTFTRTLFSPL